MQATVHYLQLRAYCPACAEHEPIPISLEELEGLWFCSRRNVKKIIKKLLDNGWIEWYPGIGRGNVSRVSFLIALEKLLLQMATELVYKGS